jgi:hypothetical protein
MDHNAKTLRSGSTSGTVNRVAVLLEHGTVTQSPDKSKSRSLTLDATKPATIDTTTRSYSCTYKA